jgi:DNA-binding NarL/FixJ family response regulator
MSYVQQKQWEVGRPPEAPLAVRVIAGSLERATRIAELLDDDSFDVEVAIGRVAEARRAAPEGAPGDVVVVTDLERPADVREAARSHPGARVVVIGQMLEPAETRQLLEAGAAGIVDEANGLEVVPHAVRLVCLGAICLPAQMREIVEPIALSTRERQVLALMASGLSNAEIADQLFLSESTIKSHAASAFRRLGVRSRREAVAMILGSNETLRRSVLMSHPMEGVRRGGLETERAGDRGDPHHR